MLAQLTEDLEQPGVQLLLARDLGHVRDVVRRSREDTVLRLDPTVKAGRSTLCDTPRVATPAERSTALR